MDAIPETDGIEHLRSSPAGRRPSPSGLMSEGHFDALHADMMAHAQGRELFAKDLFVAQAAMTGAVASAGQADSPTASITARSLMSSPT